MSEPINAVEWTERMSPRVAAPKFAIPRQVFEVESCREVGEARSSAPPEPRGGVANWTREGNPSGALGPLSTASDRMTGTTSRLRS